MRERDINQPAGPRPPIAVRWLRPPIFVALLLGAVLGTLFGTITGNLLALGIPESRWKLFDGMSGALLGLMAGIIFVGIGLLLYQFIRGVRSGAIVLGLFGLLAMALVGGLFGAVIGFVAGAVLGALVGGIKVWRGRVVGSVPPRRRRYFP
jgi:hypothetical protein